MVQGYAQANTPNPSGWCPSLGSQGGYFRGSELLQSIIIDGRRDYANLHPMTIGI